MARGTKSKRMAQQRAFGRRVRLLRTADGLSQEALADRAGLDPTYISSIERGQRNVSLDSIYALADAFSVPVAQLLEDTG